MVKIGDKLPSFNLKDDQNNSVTEKNFLGRYTVLYFYPKDNTPGCTTESIDFNNALEEFTKLGAAIVGVSKDDLDSHQCFIRDHNLKFSLLSDPSQELHKAMGAYGEKTSYGKTSIGTIRSTFIIDKNLQIAAIFSPVTVKEHATKVLAKLQELVR